MNSTQFPTKAARREFATVAAMIRLFCRHKHGSRGELCVSCEQLLDYAARRVEHCPHGENKMPCSCCEIHCYEKSRRERIREIMRYAGPRMIFRHPIMAIRHLIQMRRHKKSR